MNYIEICMVQHDGFEYFRFPNLPESRPSNHIKFKINLDHAVNDVPDDRILKEVSSHILLRSALRFLSKEYRILRFRIQLIPDADIDCLYDGDSDCEVTVTIPVDHIEIYGSKTLS